jgi:hypothetical protein
LTSGRDEHESDDILRFRHKHACCFRPHEDLFTGSQLELIGAFADNVHVEFHSVAFGEQSDAEEGACRSDLQDRGLQCSCFCMVQAR